MMVLSIVELYFTIDSFQYLEKTHTWASKTERAKIAFLIFSSARTIFLAAVYTGFHRAQKHFHSMFYTIFVVLSTIFWIISGVLIHQIWGTIICSEGVGRINGGLTECQELKIIFIGIISWVLAGVSVLAAIPVVMNATKKRRMQAQRKTNASG